jgi:hypothetical protein
VKSSKQESDKCEEDLHSYRRSDSRGGGTPENHANNLRRLEVLANNALDKLTENKKKLSDAEEAYQTAEARI